VYSLAVAGQDKCTLTYLSGEEAIDKMIREMPIEVRAELIRSGI